MSGIAEIMHNLGYEVQGSDKQANYNTKRLEGKGIKIFLGHQANRIREVSYLVVSSAISPDNEEVQEALRIKIPIIQRSEMLAELMRLKCSVAVSGSHGKTTTTSLLACLFEHAGLEPTVINGGIINNRSTNAYIGTGEYLIAEADESDATFIKIPATIAIITNIDPEHMDFYQDFPSLIAAFRSFITNLPFYGFGVCCIDHPVVRTLVQDITKRKIITYGIDSEDAHIRAYNISSDVNHSTFDIKIQLPGTPKTKEPIIVQQIHIPTPGRHNILNALAAIAVGVELDIDPEIIKNGFKSFCGVKRRFTKVFEYKGAEIIDDYAHHPVEVMATLSTARAIADKQGGKVVAIFQPHRYSRLAYLFDEFAKCFEHADQVYITDIYSAGELPIVGITAQSLVKKIQEDDIDQAKAKIISFISNPEDIALIIAAQAQQGDLFMMMGAGNITNWAYQLPETLDQKY